jgi:hypothetical protein
MQGRSCRRSRLAWCEAEAARSAGVAHSGKGTRNDLMMSESGARTGTRRHVSYAVTYATRRPRKTAKGAEKHGARARRTAGVCHKVVRVQLLQQTGLRTFVLAHELHERHRW